MSDNLWDRIEDAIAADPGPITVAGIAAAIKPLVEEARREAKAEALTRLSETQGSILRDLRDLLVALDMGDHARPESPHEVMRQAIATARTLRREAKAEALREAADRMDAEHHDGTWTDWLRDRADEIGADHE